MTSPSARPPDPPGAPASPDVPGLPQDASPATVAEAERLQEQLRSLVRPDDPEPFRPAQVVCGFDVAYDAASDLVAGAVVALAAPDWRVIAQATAVRRADFPYVPGLFSFRELPALLDAWRRLALPRRPDLLVCDGYGLAHPRRFGLACHVGVTLDLPTVGVAKTRFVGSYSAPGPRRGDHSPILLDGEEVGCALRTQPGVREVFVSVGHRTNLPAAVRHVLALCPRYRLPETTRAADRLARAALRKALAGAGAAVRGDGAAPPGDRALG